MNILADIDDLKRQLSFASVNWDGVAAVTEMKRENFRHACQTEWPGFYLEFLAARALAGSNFVFPGSRYGNVEFDLRSRCNWDLKSSSDLNPNGTTNRTCILNDVSAIRQSIRDFGVHGVVIVTYTPEYDLLGTFRAWHDSVCGVTPYVIKNAAANRPRRIRKVRAVLDEVLFVELTEESLGRLQLMHQGRNSNGLARQPKFKFSKVENADLIVDAVQL